MSSVGTTGSKLRAIDRVGKSKSTDRQIIAVMVWIYIQKIYRISPDLYCKHKSTELSHKSLLPTTNDASFLTVPG